MSALLQQAFRDPCTGTRLEAASPRGGRIRLSGSSHPLPSLFFPVHFHSRRRRVSRCLPPRLLLDGNLKQEQTQTQRLYMNLSNPNNPMREKGANFKIPIFPLFTYWLILFAIFVTVLFASSDGSQIFSDVKSIDRAIIGASGCLLGMAGGWILLGVIYQAKALRPRTKKVGLVAIVAISLCVITANLVWGFFRSMPYFDLALGLGFSGAGLFWLRRGTVRNWGSTNGEKQGQS